MGDPSFSLLILQGESWAAPLITAARELGLQVHRAPDPATGWSLIAGGRPVLVVAEPAVSPLSMVTPEQVDVVLVGPATPEAVQQAFDEGASDWLTDPTDPVAVQRVLASHAGYVARRRYQQEMLDALARALQHHLQPARVGQTGVARVVLHEVRNALAALQLNVDALGHDLVETPAEVRETLEDLSDLTRHLAAVVGSGRTLLGEGTGGGDVAHAVRAAVTMTGTRSSSEVQVSLDPNLPRVALPTHQLAQILLNTTLNALHAGAVQVSIAGLELPGRVHITVTDDGAGMTAEDLGRSLDRGYTTKETGTGLGLAICKEILDAVGGSIQLASQFGAGTTVVIEVPWLPDPH